MFVLNLRQNGFRRIESKSLLSSSNRVIIVQRIVHSQTPAFLNEISAESDRREAEIPDDGDSFWKVGALVSAAGGMENAVTNAVSIGSVMHRYGSVI